MVNRDMSPPKHLRRLKKMYKKVKSAQEWLDRHLESRSLARYVQPWDGMSPEKTVKLYLIEQGISVQRNRLPTIDYRIKINGEWKTLEVKSDILRPGQEDADEYAVILYPNKDNKSKECIILTTFEVSKDQQKIDRVSRDRVVD